MNNSTEYHYNQRMTYTYGGNMETRRDQLFGQFRKYIFTYDGLSRLTKAVFDSPGFNSHNTSYSYDKNGNMLKLNRHGRTWTDAYGVIDSLSITLDGNRLKKVHDLAASIPFLFSQDFKNYANVATEYEYNTNGSMKTDLNKGISDIQYNVLNLPNQIDIKNPVAEARNEYHYNADGVKRKVIKKWNPNYSTNPVMGSNITASSLTSMETTDYVGNLVFVNNTFQRALTENGYIEGGV